MRNMLEDEDYNGGFDFKYSLTPSLTLDTTYRTDFAQVEVDQQQTNLTRFNLFFPEKREFFLENAGHVRVWPAVAISSRFSAGGSASARQARRCRSSAAARVSGQLAGYNVGFLAMKTEQDGERRRRTTMSSAGSGEIC